MGVWHINPIPALAPAHAPGPAPPSLLGKAGNKTQQNRQLFYGPEENDFPPGATKESRALFSTSLRKGSPPTSSDLMGP